MNAIEAGDARFYNLGIGKGYSVREVLDAAGRVTGKEIPVVYGDRRPGDPPVLFANADKIRGGSWVGRRDMRRSTRLWQRRGTGSRVIRAGMLNEPKEKDCIGDISFSVRGKSGPVDGVDGSDGRFETEGGRSSREPGIVRAALRCSNMGLGGWFDIHIVGRLSRLGSEDMKTHFTGCMAVVGCLLLAVVQVAGLPAAGEAAESARARDSDRPGPEPTSARHARSGRRSAADERLFGAFGEHWGRFAWNCLTAGRTNGAWRTRPRSSSSATCFRPSGWRIRRRSRPSWPS